MKVTKQYLKKLIKEQLTQEMSAPTPIQEAAGGVVYLVGVDIPYESPNIYGAFSDKKAALKAAVQIKKMEGDDVSGLESGVGIWTISVNNKIADHTLLDTTFKPLK